MKVGSLFSGVGGFDLGLERAGMEVVWQVEKDEQARSVLRRHWPELEMHTDVCDVHHEWHKNNEPIQRREARGLSATDVVCGGFP